jgi:hypothetical protein
MSLYDWNDARSVFPSLVFPSLYGSWSDPPTPRGPQLKRGRPRSAAVTEAVTLLESGEDWLTIYERFINCLVGDERRLEKKRFRDVVMKRLKARRKTPAA